MDMKDIVSQTVTYMQQVTVEIDSPYSTVCISDDTGFHPDIFMQGHDAERFIAEIEAFEEAHPHINRADIELVIALPYVDSCWN